VTIPLPRLSAPELRRKLLRLGFVEDRQKGSHLILRHRDDPSRYAVVSIHSRGVVPPGTLKHILTTAGIEPEELAGA
jgi:predicted RNA binding protein YcfA (HicA-like mRNA interferase family)